MKSTINFLLCAIILSLVHCTAKKSEQNNTVKVTPLRQTVKKVALPATTIFPSNTPAQRVTEDNQSDYGLIAWNQNYFQSITFSKAAKLYDTPSDTSKVLAIVPTRTPIEILKYNLLNIPKPPAPQGLYDAYERRHGENVDPEIVKADNILIESYERLPERFEPWYKVKVNNKYGYLKGENVVRHVFKSDVNDIEYLILIDSSAYNPNRLTVLKYDWSNRRILDSLSYATSHEGEFNVHQVQNPVLKGVRMVLRISHTMDFCGGGTEITIFTDGKDGLKLFPFTYYGGGENGYYDNAFVYIPVRDKNGQVKLTSIALDSFEGKGYDNKLLQKARLPVEDVVIVDKETGYSALDAKDNPIVLKNGRIKMHSITKETELYSWNGADLKLITKQKSAVKP